jgi:uncharacterized membrane protein YeaQ/YmgE (transglycosylase-associated protein family)
MTQPGRTFETGQDDRYAIVGPLHRACKGIAVAWDRSTSRFVEPSCGRDGRRRPSFAVEVSGMLVSIIAWIVLGAIAGYVAGLLVRGDEGLGVLGHIVLGIVGALVGGFIANALGFGSGREGGDVVNLQSILVAVVGAVIVVWVVALVTRGRAGRAV